MPAEIVLTAGVAQYRETVPFYVNKKDTVLEIGCAEGTTSRLLYQHAGYLVAIEKGPTIDEAKRLYPDIRFEKIDAANVGEVLALGFQFNKIYIDISGSGPLHSIVRFIDMYDATFQPELIVVKNDRLRSLVKRSVVWESKQTSSEYMKANVGHDTSQMGVSFLLLQRRHAACINCFPLLAWRTRKSWCRRGSVCCAARLPLFLRHSTLLARAT